MSNIKYESLSITKDGELYNMSFKITDSLLTSLDNKEVLASVWLRELVQKLAESNELCSNGAIVTTATLGMQDTLSTWATKIEVKALTKLVN